MSVNRKVVSSIVVRAMVVPIGREASVLLYVLFELVLSVVLHAQDTFYRDTPLLSASSKSRSRARRVPFLSRLASSFAAQWD